MNILVLNASPKGKQSTTVHTALYLGALHPEHTFTFLPVGQRMKSYEKDFTPLRKELEKAELILFSYPVYTFIAPYQLHRLMELIKADGVDLSGKFASQITTSKHFYDVTAHRYVEENCCDLGMKVVRGCRRTWRICSPSRGSGTQGTFLSSLCSPVSTACSSRRPSGRLIMKRRFILRRFRPYPKAGRRTWSSSPTAPPGMKTCGI